MQSACSLACAQVVGRANSAKKAAAEAKEDRKATKKARERLKTRSDWLKEAQVAFNRWIRLRDSAEPCISCDRHHDGQYHAGHYYSAGARPELRFEPLNVHKQCSACNAHLSGNLVLYRFALLRKIGHDAVDWLEGPHEPAKWTIEDLQELRDRYRNLARVALQCDSQTTPEKANDRDDPKP